MLSQLPRTSQHPKLDDICAVCGVADATIRAIYKDMHPYLVGRGRTKAWPWS